jgi:NADH-quinone oxidoreductase subunit C
MEIGQIVADINGAFGPGTTTAENLEGAQPYLVVATQHIAEVCQWLHTHPGLYFDYLSCLSGVDNGPEAGTMEVVYHLHSIVGGLSLVLKVLLPRRLGEEGGSQPSVPSVSGIWATANWHEREAFDLLGIYFTGHPDLRRILLPADWEGHPLRKDYQLQDYYHGIKTVYEPS